MDSFFDWLATTFANLPDQANRLVDAVVGSPGITIIAGVVLLIIVVNFVVLGRRRRRYWREATALKSQLQAELSANASLKAKLGVAEETTRARDKTIAEQASTLADKLAAIQQLQTQATTTAADHLKALAEAKEEGEQALVAERDAHRIELARRPAHPVIGETGALQAALNTARSEVEQERQRADRLQTELSTALTRPTPTGTGLSHAAVAAAVTAFEQEILQLTGQLRNERDMQLFGSIGQLFATLRRNAGLLSATARVV